jgi:transcriptional regulator with XRE-family HTH domain
MAANERQLELGRFLRDRRARLQPGDVGLPQKGRRRVAGLRREEVATLAGVGLTWYTMLENGTAARVSSATLGAIASALHLSPAETEYLTFLADGHATLPAPRPQADRLTLGALESVAWAPAYVCTSQWTVLAWNDAMSLVWGIEAPGGAPFNIVSRMFRDPAIRAMHGARFEPFARSLVAMVRSGAGRRIEDPAYRQLREELRDDPVFESAWEAYDVAAPSGSIPTLVDSAAVGEFAYEALTLLMPGDSGHSIVVQVPDADSAARLRTALRRNPARTRPVLRCMQDVKEGARHAAPATRTQPLALLGTTLWAGSWDTDHLYAIDTKNWTTTADVAAPGRPFGLTALGDELRVVISHGEDEDRYIYRFTPSGGFDLASKTACPELNGSHLAADGAKLYLCQATNRRIVELDAAGGIVREIPLPTRCAGMGFGPGGFYMLSADEDFDNVAFARFDIAASSPEVLPLAGIVPEARSLVFDGAAWWTSLREGGEIISFTV